MFRELLSRHAGHIPELTQVQQDQLERHFKLLLKWNAKLNLSAVRTEAEIVQSILEECSRIPVTESQAALVFAGQNWHRGVLGIVANRKNLIVMLMAIELILLAVNLNLVAFSAYLHDLVGQVFAMFVLTVAAGEAAIGLAILVIYFRGRGTISVDDVNRMKG